MSDLWRAAGVNPPTPRGDPMKREPVLTVASITSLIAAVLTLLTVFGVKLSGDQQAAILGVVAIAAPLVVALFSRPRVTPVEPPPARRAVGQYSLASALVVCVALVLLFILVLRLA